MGAPPVQAAHASPQQIAFRESKKIMYLIPKKVDNSQTYFLSAANFKGNPQQQEKSAPGSRLAGNEAAGQQPKTKGKGGRIDKEGNLHGRLSREQACAWKQWADSAAVENSKKSKEYKAFRAQLDSLREKGGRTWAWHNTNLPDMYAAKSAQNYCDCIVWFYNSGLYDLAKESCSSALKYASAMDKGITSQVHAIRAMILMREGKLSEALLDLNAALKLNPSNKMALDLKAEVAKAMQTPQQKK